MPIPQTKLCGDKRCLRAGEHLPLEDFPRNRTRPGGRHGYCRVCSLRRTHEYRDKLRAMKAARELLKPKPEPRPNVRPAPKPIERKPGVISKVEEAIRSGASTMDRLHEETQLSYDVIGRALTYLIFDTGKFRIKRTGERREFIAA